LLQVNAVCPGWCRTNMAGDKAPRSAEQGASTPVWLATTDGLGTGKYVVASMAAASWHRCRYSLHFLVAVAS